MISIMVIFIWIKSILQSCCRNRHHLKIIWVKIWNHILPDEATSDAIILSNIYSRQTLKFPLAWELCKNSLHIVTASCEVRQSQIPSQAMIKNSFDFIYFSTFISGTHVIIYCSTDIVVSYLYSKSPRDLERFNIPLTLFSSTKPPAFSILAFSWGKSGLWSVLISIAFPSYERTHLESPAFAQ